MFSYYFSILIHSYILSLIHNYSFIQLLLHLNTHNFTENGIITGVYITLLSQPAPPPMLPSLIYGCQRAP